jgi:hypothetical protein
LANEDGICGIELLNGVTTFLAGLMSRLVLKGVEACCCGCCTEENEAPKIPFLGDILRGESRAGVKLGCDGTPVPSGRNRLPRAGVPSLAFFGDSLSGEFWA